MPPSTIFADKELEQAYQPLLLATITLIDGTVLRYSTHGLSTAYGGFPYNGHDYLPKIKTQNIEAIQAMSSLGVDQPPSITIILEDTDKSILNDYEFITGFEGALVDLTLIEWNVGQNQFSSDSIRGKFTGRSSAAQASATTISLLVTTKLNLTQAYLPTFHVQSRCSNLFATTAEQRLDGSINADSPFFPCGYSPDVVSDNGVGNYESGTTPFVVCDYTKANCVARGMYTVDSLNRKTGRFTGSTWIPVQTWSSRGYTDPANIQGFNNNNEGKFNDLVPRVWGISFVDPIVMNVVGDANQTKMELLMCDGDVGPDGIQLLIVNDIVVDQAGGAGSIPLSTQLKVGLWWNFVNEGNRIGAPNLDSLYDGNGDPYGSLCVVEAVVPKALASSDTIPRVRCLVRGPQLNVYSPFITNMEPATPTSGSAKITFTGQHPFEVGDAVTIRESTGLLGGNVFVPVTAIGGNYVIVTSPMSGTYTGGGFCYSKKFTQNQAYILMDALIRLGYLSTDFDLDAWSVCGIDCGTSITCNSIFGGTFTQPRYNCNLSIRQRTSGAELVRRMRTNGKIILVPNSSNGLLGAYCKKPIAVSQASPIPGSNFNTKILSSNIDGSGPVYGYAAYKFDASTIARTGKNGDPQVSLSQKTIPDCVGSVSVAFQDSENAYGQDSITVSDTEKVVRVGGQVVQGGLPADGIPTFDQGRRVIQTYLAEMYRGNPRNYFNGGDAGGTVTLQIGSSFRVSHLRIGHVVLVDHPQYAAMAGLLEDDSANPINGFLAMVEAIKPSQNFETAQVVVSFWNDLWYQDLWGQRDLPPAAANANQNRLARPPFGWMPGLEAPVSGDVLFDSTDENFTISQDYTLDASGNPLVQLSVAGKLPVNSFTTVKSPFLPLQGTTATTGGHLTGGFNYFITVCARDVDGLWAPAPLIKCRIFVPAGTNTNTITVSSVVWGDNTTDWGLWAGIDQNYMSLQGIYSSLPAAVTTSGGVNPSSLTLLGSASVAGGLNQATEGLPDVEFDHIEFAVKEVEHSGVLGSKVLAVSGQVIEIAQGGDTVDLFAGYLLTILSTATLGLNVPIVDYTISHNDTAGHLTLSVTGPNPAIIQVGDVVVIRSRPSSVTSTTMSDPAWQNSEDTAGLVVNGEVGNIIRFIAGTGRGTTAIIASNAATQLTVSSPWTITPDSTSVYIIESPSWASTNYTVASQNTDLDAVQTTSIDVSNLLNRVLLVKAWTADPEGNPSFDAYSPFREIYLSGVTQRPPFPWMPNEVGPPVNDAVYALTDRTFSLRPISQSAADGSAIMSVEIGGELPINVFSTIATPKLPNNGTTVSTGGILAGNTVYYVAFVGLDTGGMSTDRSNICAITVPSGTNTNKVTIPGPIWDSANAGWSVYAGTDPDYLSFQATSSALLFSGITYVGTLAVPTSITLAGISAAGVPTLAISAGGVPDDRFDHLEGSVNYVQHSGVVGTTVTAVTDSTHISIAQGGFTSDQFANYVLSLIAYKSNDPLDIMNFSIEHNDGSGNLTLSGPDATLLHIGDIITIRSKAATVTATTLQDPNWVNSEFPTGLIPDSEAGDYIFILAGTGRGTSAQILSNTADTYTVASWDVQPDATSIYVVVGASQVNPTDTLPVSTIYRNLSTFFLLPIPNLSNESILVRIWSVSVDGTRSIDFRTPMRDLFLMGAASNPSMVTLKPQTVNK